MKTIFVSNQNKSDFIGCTITFGHFSTIHPGHVRYLSNAKKKGCKLVIAIIGDSSSNKDLRFKYSQNERANALRMLNLADGLYLLKKDHLSEIIKILKPSNLVLGNEFKYSKNPEIIKSIHILKENKGNIFFDAGVINYTSSYLLEEPERYVKDKRSIAFREALKRLNIKKSDLLESVKKFKAGNVLVIGDTIIDQYIDSEPLGISAEAPVIVVREINKKNFIGGAAIVAAHIKSLGSICKYISVVGEDQINDFLTKSLSSYNIDFNLIKDLKRPTTLKKRYLVENQKIFRVSKLDSKEIEKELESKIIENIERISEDINVIVISDFNYGVITERILEEITNLSKKKNITLIGDVQCSSQIGYVTKLKDFDLICANEKEVRIALNDNSSGLETLCRNLINETGIKNLIMKLGSEGIIFYQVNHDKYVTSQPFPALSSHPIDTAGAGDSLLATMASGISAGVPINISTALSCFVSAISVKRMGNIPISNTDLILEIKNMNF